MNHSPATQNAGISPSQCDVDLNDVESLVSSRYAELHISAKPEKLKAQQVKLGLDCPSIHPHLARSVIGVYANDERKVRFVSEELPVPVTLGRIIEPHALALRARFAGRCITSGCTHWTGTGCRLGQVVAEVGTEINGQLPPCSIRKTCRWFIENGASACSPCQHLRYLHMADRESVERSITSRAGQG